MVNTEDFSRALEIFGKQQQKQERVVLIGGGNVGRMVAQKLEDLPGRAIRAKMIERDRKIAERSAEALERTIVLNGDGLDASLLQEAGAHARRCGFGGD